MPEELIAFITGLDDVVLLKLLAWLRVDQTRAIEELEAVVSRQAPSLHKQRTR